MDESLTKGFKGYKAESERNIVIGGQSRLH